MPDDNNVKTSHMGFIIKFAASVIVAGVGLFSAFTTIDDRYAHATETTQRFTTVEKTQTQVQQQIDVAVKRIRRQQLEDYIFTYDFKVQNKSATPLDKALLERYKRELSTIPNQ